MDCTANFCADLNLIAVNTNALNTDIPIPTKDTAKTFFTRLFLSLFAVLFIVFLD